MTSPYYALGRAFERQMREYLVELPRRTPGGRVVPQTVAVNLGYPGGSHGETQYWRYTRKSAEFSMLFAFYRNFTPHDLICKVVRNGELPSFGDGASIQLNSDRTITQLSGGHLQLHHHGSVTVVYALKRERLWKLIQTTAPDEAEELGLTGPHDWPFVLGDTRAPGALLDRLFLYAYCIEQAKRKERQERDGTVESQEIGDERVPPGQGRQMDPAVRDAVEHHACALVEKYFRRMRYTVKLTSNTAGSLDYICTRGQEKLYVEVKGTTGAGSSVMVTHREVKRAQSDRACLAVVTEIQVDRTVAPPLASGGRLMLYDPWDPTHHVLEPRTYECHLDTQRSRTVKP
jgi:hypothetical protein